MPHGDFLNVLAGAAAALPNFRLLRNHEAIGLMERDGTVRGVPTVGTQLLQRTAQRFLVEPTLASSAPVRAPASLRMLARFPRLQALPARIIGIGLRPERLNGRDRRSP